MKLKTSKKMLKIVVYSALVFFVVYSACFISASDNLFVWNSGIGFGLPAYNSVIDASDTLFFSEFSWNQNNASSITLKNVCMNEESTIESLTISSDVNITFIVLSNDQFTYSVAAVGSQNFTGLNEPNTVMIDGFLTESGWTYTNHVLMVSGASSSVNILFYDSSTTIAKEHIAGVFTDVYIALGLVSISIIVSSFVLMYKSSQEPESESIIAGIVIFIIGIVILVVGFMIINGFENSVNIDTVLVFVRKLF